MVTFSINSVSSSLSRAVAKTARCADKKLRIRTTPRDNKTIGKVKENEIEELRKREESFLVYLSVNKSKNNNQQRTDEETINKTEDKEEKITKVGSRVKQTIS